ncbi:proline and serine-rich protein 3 [Chanos chanos]|uniref:Proline and serine-rich protein 3 n=1 Tax=Chanos chanos TaxID=29144 RepID=A0A6J2W0M4_CHACN|nr:proline and serine-rich protein 3 [Chanos chanos]
MAILPNIDFPPSLKTRGRKRKRRGSDANGRTNRNNRENPCPPDLFVDMTYYNPSKTKVLQQRRKLGRGSALQSTAASPRTNAQKQTSLPKKTLTEKDSTQQDESLLEKYVDRFRHGPPQSRKERECLTTEVAREPFWWTSPSLSPTSRSTVTQGNVPEKVPKDGQSSIRRLNDQSQHTFLSRHTDKHDSNVLDPLDPSHDELTEPEVLKIMERTSQLLHRSEQSLGSDSFIISSEGMGCSNLSSPISVDEPVRRPAVPSLLLSVSGGKAVPSLSGTSAIKTPLRPEDDILFRWRLMRKYDLAKQHALMLSQNVSLNTVPLSPLNDRQTQQAQPQSFSASAPQTVPLSLSPDLGKPCDPGPPQVQVPTCHMSNPTVSSIQPYTTIQPHIHHLCDILPCGLLQSSRESSLGVPQPSTSTLHDSNVEASTKPSNKNEPCLPPTPQRDKNEPCLPPTPQRDKNEPCLPPTPQHNKSTETECVSNQGRGEIPVKQRSETEPSDGKTSSSGRKKQAVKHACCLTGSRERSKKQCQNEGRGQRGYRTKESSQHSTLHEKGQGSTQGGHSKCQALPPSPIHGVLGQVISEVLLPAPESPDQQRNLCSSYSGRYTTSPSSSLPQPGPETTQLLQYAEDSDGLEFEDDPLLQVLRQQRRWVRERICEVDAMLDEIC